MHCSYCPRTVAGSAPGNGYVSVHPGGYGDGKGERRRMIKTNYNMGVPQGLRAGGTGNNGPPRLFQSRYEPKYSL